MKTPTRFLLLFLLPALAVAADRINGGTPFTLTDSRDAPNGAWCWFQDERAIVDMSDPANPLLLVSTVSAARNGDPESGDIDILWRNLATGEQGSFELNDRLERDDHNNASLYIRPDGRYLAMYSKHSTDRNTRWRVSTRAGDPTEWEPEQRLDNGKGTTYNNTYFLAADNGGKGRLYNFTRAGARVIQVSDDHGLTWKRVGHMISAGGAYVRYASNGREIHFITTDTHPHGFENNVYHGTVKDGVLYGTDGAVIDADLFDFDSVAPSALPKVFENGTVFDGTPMHRAWTISLEMDPLGRPVAVFTARADDSKEDHRFFFARHDGERWHVHQMAKAGGHLYDSQLDYTGLAAIDPDRVNVVYLSTEIDPRDGRPTDHYEIYRGETPDGGASWNWTAITEDSTMDNLRPVVPAWNGDNTVVMWMRGNYRTFKNWDTEIVGVVLREG